MEVNRVDMVEELVTLFSLLDDEDVIHIPKAELQWIRAELTALTSNYFINRFANRGLMEEPMVAP